MVCDWRLVAGAILIAACGTEGAAATLQQPAARLPVDDRPSVAALSEATGDVRWQRASEPAWGAARAGLPLHASDSVQTMQDAAAGIRFVRTGAIALLGPGTTLRIPEQAPELTRLRHLSGRLVARLGQGGPGRMEVELPPGTLVLEPPLAGTGTTSPVEARVEVHEEHTEIAMLRGEGRLQRTRGGSVALGENQFMDVRADGEILEQGHMGARAEPLAPTDGATLRTRRDVRFAWLPVAGAEAVRVTVQPAGGAARRHELPAGRNDLSIELPSGTYSWSVAGLVAGVPMPASAARTLVVDLDRTPPALVVESPRAGTTVAGPMARVAGRTEIEAHVAIDGHDVAVEPDGSFSAAIPVPRGLTNLVVVATDVLGNVRAVSRAVLRE